MVEDAPRNKKWGSIIVSFVANEKEKSEYGYQQDRNETIKP